MGVAATRLSTDFNDIKKRCVLLIENIVAQRRSQGTEWKGRDTTRYSAETWTEAAAVERGLRCHGEIKQADYVRHLISGRGR